MRTQSPGSSYLALPHGTGPHPGVVVVHEASGLNDNIRDICGRFAAEGYAALGVDLFEGRNRAVCRVLETELTAAGVPHDLKVYPGAKHLLQRPVALLPPRRGGGLLAAGPGLFRRARPA